MPSNNTHQATAVFPASFDPLTNGHIDVANRALAMFGRLVIAVAYNVAKQGTFTRDERVGMLESVFGNEPRVEVTAFDTLTVDFAKEIGLRAKKYVTDKLSPKAVSNIMIKRIFQISENM